MHFAYHSLLKLHVVVSDDGSAFSSVHHHPLQTEPIYESEDLCRYGKNDVTFAGAYYTSILLSFPERIDLGTSASASITRQALPWGNKATATACALKCCGEVSGHTN